MKIAQPHRARRAGKTAALVLALVAAVSIVASAAFGASTSSSPLRVSTATIGSSGSKLTVSGSFACKSRRFFTLTLFALEPSTGASVHGSVPAGAAHAPACTPPRKSFKILADQQGEKQPRDMKKTPVRLCFIIRSFGPHVPLGLDATCVTLKAR